MRFARSEIREFRSRFGLSLDLFCGWNRLHVGLINF